MGREIRGLKVSVTLSSHNSDQDRIDEALWAEFCKAVEELAAQPKFASIMPMVL
jgi:hypothetical protein